MHPGKSQGGLIHFGSRCKLRTLFDTSIISLDKNLTVADLTYTIKTGELETISSKTELEKGEAFSLKNSRTEKQFQGGPITLRYDIVGKLTDDTKLTRNTIVKILKGIKPKTFLLFRKNPEEFLLGSAKIINEQKAHAIIEYITYNKIEDKYDTSIFTENNLNASLGQNAIEVKKHIYDYLRYDSETEKDFAKALDVSKEVLVYAKLPGGFFIPTPVGNYNPDWAIVFDEGRVRHIYFIAETKGDLESLEFDIRGKEKAKIHCAREHFKAISKDHVKYNVVKDFEELMTIVKGK